MPGRAGSGQTRGCAYGGGLAARPFPAQVHSAPPPASPTPTLPSSQGLCSLPASQLCLFSSLSCRTIGAVTVHMWHILCSLQAHPQPLQPQAGPGLYPDAPCQPPGALRNQPGSSGPSPPLPLPSPFRSPQHDPGCCRHGGRWAPAPRGHWMTPQLQNPAIYDSRPSAPTQRGTGKCCLLYRQSRWPSCSPCQNHMATAHLPHVGPDATPGGLS